MRLGLFGGSFDPVHLGHLLVAQAALEELNLDRLAFIPAAQSPFKPGTRSAPGGFRARMLRLALAGYPKYSVDEFEIQRGGISYSIETVREYRRRQPGAQLFWLIGADHVPSLPTWREAATLAELVEFVVIPRPGEPPARLPEPFRLRPLNGWPVRISSSEIRVRVRDNRLIRHLVPAGVSEVIADEKLYRSELPIKPE